MIHCDYNALSDLIFLESFECRFDADFRSNDF